jgi:TubC N-terminal docking domain
MTAVELVATLRARGVVLVPVGDRLRFRPGEAVTPEEREMLVALKPEVMAILAPLTLDPVTLRTVLGARPEPTVVQALEAEVRAGIQQYQVEVATGVLGRGALTVHGRPLSDYLDLDTVAWLLGARPSREAR